MSKFRMLGALAAVASVVGLAACYKGEPSTGTDPEAPCTEENYNSQGDVAFHAADDIPCAPADSDRVVVFDLTSDECEEFFGISDTYEYFDADGNPIRGNACIFEPIT
jgi:hypothetical protein